MTMKIGMSSGIRIGRGGIGVGSVYGTGGQTFVQRIPEYPIVAIRGMAPNILATGGYEHNSVRIRLKNAAQAAIELGFDFPNYYVDTNGSGEIATGNDITIEAALENSAGSIVNRILFDGQNILTVPNGETRSVRSLKSSLLGSADTSGFNGEFFLRLDVRCPPGGRIPACFSNGQTGDGTFLNNSVTNQCMNTGAIIADGGISAAGYMPIAVRGKWKVARGISMGIHGDSIDYGSNGTGLTGFGNSNGGSTMQALYNLGGTGLVASAKLARGGDRAASFLTAGSQRRLIRDGMTHVKFGAGTNDLAAGMTGRELWAIIETIGKEYASAGVFFIYRLLFPKTLDPTFNWATKNDQVLNAAFDTARDYVIQAALDAQGSWWLGALLDLRSVVEDAEDHRCWKTTGVADAVTDDGIHPANVYIPTIAAAEASLYSTLIVP